MFIISFSSWERAHQNRGKLIYETFVKDYVVVSDVVKDKLLFILQTPLKSKTLKKMSKKTYDPRLVWPYSLLFYVVQPVVERLLGLLNYFKLMKNCVPICLRNPFGFMVLNNQICLELLKKFGPLINVNLLKVFLKT